MARKRKSDEDEEKPATGAATATEDEEEEESDAGDTGDGSDDAGDGSGTADGGHRPAVSDDEKDAFDAADEADSIADLSEKEQDERLLDLQRRGFDVSVVRARLNHKKRKQHAQTAELERLQPVKFPDGTQAAGTLDRFEAPFSELGIKDVARKVYAGGTYAILYYDGNHVIKHREVFTVPGKPKSTDEVEELKKTTPPPPPPPDQSGGGRAYHLPEVDTEKEALREQIRNHELRTMLAEQDRRHQEQMRVLMDAVKGATEKRSSSLPDIIAAAAPFVPVFAAFVSARGKDKQDIGELMKAFRDQNNDTLKQMKEALDTTARGQRNDPMAAATVKMLDLAIAKTMGSDSRDPSGLMMDMMKRIMPQMAEQMMEMATMAAGRSNDAEPDDGKISPKFMVEKMSEMLKPFMENMRRGGQAGPASAMPGMPGMPGMPMMPGMPYPGMQYPYPYPGAPQNPNSVHPTAGVYPYTTAPPPPQAPPAAAPGLPPPASALSPASAIQPGVAPPPMVPPATPGGPTPPPGPTAPNGAPVPTAQAQANETGDIHPQVFVLMYQFLQAGKTGGDLAEFIDSELADIAEKKKVGPRLLSDGAIETLETMKPELLADEFFKAAPPQMLAPFLVAPPPGTPPGTPPQIAPHVRAFAFEFCKWWNDNKEE